MNLPDLLAHYARKSPQKAAIIDQKETVTYAEWDMTATKLANQFIQLGVEPGDKVVLHMPNSKEFLFVYMAVQRIGAVIVPINAKLVGMEVNYILKHCDAKVFITHELLMGQLTNFFVNDSILYFKTGNTLQGWGSLDKLLYKDEEINEIDYKIKSSQTASILYTSGTTGNPKGVMFSHQNILTVANMICIEMDMKAESRVLHVMPLSHSAPLHLFMASAMVVGATHITVPTFTPELLLETVEKQQVTHFFGAPIAYLVCAKHPNIQQYNLSSIQYWVYGGAPFQKSDVLSVQKAFRTNSFICVYGLTEAGPSGTLLMPEEHHEKTGSIGRRAALHTEIRIVNEIGENVANGETGEIVLRGEGNMQGYYKDDIKTKETLKDGWLYTGDMAKQDNDGYYWIIDRKKDIILSGGVNIYPKEIEEVLLTHPNITDVAVIGIPHPDWGETVKAFLVLDDSENYLSVEEVEVFTKDKLARHKIPKIIEVLESLPRNATGKLLKNQLRLKLNS